LCLVIWGFALPAAGLAQEVFSLSAYARADAAPDYHPALSTPTRRFSYDSAAEPRGQRAARSFRLALGGIPGELGQIVTFPVRDPKTTGLFLLGAAALVSIDRQTTTFWQDHVETVFDGFSLPALPRINHISTESEYVYGAIGLTYLGGLAFNNERAQTAALLSAKAVAYSYITSQLILKPLFGRIRPVDNLSTFSGDPGLRTTDPWAFGYGNGQIPWTSVEYATSMPSFHFTMYFAVARVYSGMYDNAFWPYLATAVVAASDIRGHHHWVSDMVAGALIGTGIGNLVLNRYENRRNRQNPLFVVPTVSRNRIGLAMSMEF
jgi:membrane-associated phospholipid phosphatase